MKYFIITKGDWSDSYFSLTIFKSNLKKGDKNKLFYSTLCKRTFNYDNNILKNIILAKYIMNLYKIAPNISKQYTLVIKTYEG